MLPFSGNNYDNGFSFYCPSTETSGKIPEQAEPLIVLLDPTPNRSSTAQELAEVGYLVLAVDSHRAECLGPAVDLITPLPVRQSVDCLKPVAIIMEAYHAVRPPTRSLTPAKPGNSNTTHITLPLPAIAIAGWLESRGLSPSEVPFLLYTADNTSLRAVRNNLEFARHSDREGISHFRAAIKRTSAGAAEDGLIATLIGLFCLACIECST